MKAYEDKWMPDDPVPTRGELRFLEALQSHGRLGKVIAWFVLLALVAVLAGIVFRMFR